MYLAKGLGIHGTSGHGSYNYEGGSGGGNGRYGGLSSDGGGGGTGGDGYGIDLEGYYKKMVEEHPGNPLLIQNYAQFLYKVKGGLKKAEEYYSRAVLTEPGDGEILSQYTKLVWEHGMTSSYFEQAARASPEDSLLRELKVHKVQPCFASLGHSVEPAPSH